MGRRWTFNVSECFHKYHPWEWARDSLQGKCCGSLLTMNQARGYAEAHKTVYKYEEILENGLDLKTCEGRYQ